MLHLIRPAGRPSVMRTRTTTPLDGRHVPASREAVRDAQARAMMRMSGASGARRAPATGRQSRCVSRFPLCGRG